MRYKKNLEETQKKFEAWWKGANKGRPLMKVVARRSGTEGTERAEIFSCNEERYTNAEKNVERYINYLNSHIFIADSLPNFDLNLGAGSMALYLGSEPAFGDDTIWFGKCLDDYNAALTYMPENFWWKKHTEMIRKARMLSNDDFLVSIPDIVENIDILAAMRGPQELCCDMMDRPDAVKWYLSLLDDLYFIYYDIMYDIVKSADGGSSYTAFDIWGPGRTAKVQCDFSALMSPEQFRDFVLPSLKKRCSRLDNVLYYLDGPDSLRHLDAILETEGLDALQWTPGAGRPDAGDPRWYYIYDRIRASGRSLWIKLEDGSIGDWIKTSERIIKRYGTEGLYILYPEMSEKDADSIMKKADNEWV